MKTIIAITLSVALAICLSACDVGGTGKAADAQGETAAGEPTAGEQDSSSGSQTQDEGKDSPQGGTGTDASRAEVKNNTWVGTYTGDDVTVEITETGNGTLVAKVQEQMLLDSDLAVSGNTATGSVTVQPEMQGGNMTLEGARESFPNCVYEFTLTVDGMSMSYSRVVTLIDMSTEDRPEQTMEFAAELTKVIKSN